MGAQAGLILCRLIFLAAAATLFGWLLFPRYAGASWPTMSRKWSASLAFLALLASVGWLLALAHGLDPTHPVWTTTAVVLTQTSFAAPWIARLLIAAAAAGSALWNVPTATLLASAGLLICEGWDGHAVTHGAFAEFNQALHALCAGAWVGGLFALAALIRAALRSKREAAAIAPLRRFSSLATAAVALILLTGVINIVLLEPALTLASTYLRVLGIKIALVLAMIACAAVNRFRLLPAIETQGGRGALVALTKTILVEQTLAVAVLAAVSALGLLDPKMTAP